MSQQGPTKLDEGGASSVWRSGGGAQTAESSTPLTGMIRFRDFEVWPGDRLLLRRRQPVCIGSRAFDLLVVLLRSRGGIVSKGAIFEYVWPYSIVEESNLRFQVASLRKVLGADRELIKSIPGRGYLFASDRDAEHNCETRSTHGPNRPVLRNPPKPAEIRPATTEPPSAVETDMAGDEALEMLLRSAGRLVAAYGSIDAILGALAEQRN